MEKLLGCVGMIVIALVIVAVLVLVQAQVIVWAWADLQPIIERAVAARSIPIGEALHIVFWFIIMAWVGLRATSVASSKK